MAPTFKHGKSAFLSITSSTGGVINCSSGVDGSSLQRAIDTAETTTYGDNDKTYIAGLRDATIPFSGHFASTYAEKLDAMPGHSTGTSWVWAPFGTASGSRKYTGSAVLTELTYEAPVDDKVSFSASLQCSGPITSTVY